MDIINNLTLDVWVTLFLLLTILEINISNKLPTFIQMWQKVAGKTALVMALAYILLFITLFLKDTQILNKVFVFALGTLILWHSLWLSFKFGYKSALAGLLVISLRILMPNSFTHNLFILSAILWLGPILQRNKLINVKRFLWISVLWFLYDIIYVWRTDLATVTNQVAETSGFPMGIVSGMSLLGSADLFWANMLVSVVVGRKFQIISIIGLIVSDILLGLYLSTSDYGVIFPLLVLWVPTGLLLLSFTKLQTRLKRK